MEHVYGILLEHVYGILLDDKFLYRSVHAAFANTKWYEAWLERTLLLDPIIFDMWSPCVLSWAPGSLATATTQDTLGKTHLLFRVFVVVLSSVTSRSVAAAAVSSLMRFSLEPDLPRRRGESLVGVSVHHSCWLCLTPSLCVYFRRDSSLLVYFRRVSPVLVSFRRVSPLLVFLLGFSCQQIQDELAVYLVLSVCVIEFLGHVRRAHRDGRWYESA